MAYLLKYGNEYEIVSPLTGGVFSADEVLTLLKTDDYCIYNLRGHDKKPTPYKIAYNPAFMGNDKKYNFLATKAILKPEFSSLLYVPVTIQLKVAPQKFFKEHPNLTFIGGLALVGTAFELKY